MADEQQAGNGSGNIPPPRPPDPRDAETRDGSNPYAVPRAARRLMRKGVPFWLKVRTREAAFLAGITEEQAVLIVRYALGEDVK